jgi:hypothetical protein
MKTWETQAYEGRNGLKMWIGFIWLLQGSMADSCEYDNEDSGFIKSEYFHN